MSTNSAPALSNDGSTLYVLESTGNWGWGKLVALNSQTLAVTAQVTLKDPHTGDDATITNDATASPLVGPDGNVYIGVLETPFASNNDRGWLLHFSGNLSQTLTPGAFGWDDTPSIVPASMVPSYTGTSTYLLMAKYNNYAGLGTGNGLNKIAILDPDDETETDPVTGATVMNAVLSILGPTPDPEYDQQYPGAVREWCINSAAVDPATDSILAGSEDGKLYRWNLTTDTFTQEITLTSGIGEAYTPTLIGPDGIVYAISNATLFAVGDSVAASVKIAPFPGTDSTAGSVNYYTVTVYTAEGDVDSTYTGTIHFSSSDQQAGLPANYTFTSGSVGVSADDNGTHVFTVTLKTAGTQSITVTDTQNSTLTSTLSGIVVTPAAAASLSVTGLPSSVTAGTAYNFTVTAHDPYGNVATGYLGTVHFTSTDPSASLPTNYPFTSANAGTESFTATLNTAGTQTIVATDTITTSIKGSASTIVSSSTSAAFIGTDTPTQGNWINVYGSQGYNVLGSAVVNPTYATVTPSGQLLYTYATPAPSVTKALEVPPSGTTRVAAVWYSGSSFTIDVNVASGHTYDLELYFLDYDARGRSETVTLTNANTSATLNTQTVSSFASGKYLTWAISGNVLITITTLTGAGASAVVSGLFFDPVGTVPPPPPPPPPPATASFVGKDTSTQGNWVGVYGSQGYDVLGSGAVNPTYATVTPSGQSLYTYATPASTVTQALEVPPPGTTRVAAVWYSGSSFTIDVNMASGHTYDLELYFLDYDARGRSETVTLTDAKTSALLNSQTVSSFANGEYLSWAISGNVLITITTLTGASASAVVSGLFFDPVGAVPPPPPPPPPPATASFVGTDTSTQGNWVGVYGSQGFNVLGSGAVNPTYATVTPSGQSLYTYATPAPTVTQALEVPPPGTTRVAAVWYSGSSFTIDVNVASGHTYDLELYFLDYDSRGRSETVTLTDAKTSALLNTQTVSSFASGKYLSWAISGNVLITFTTLTGSSASAVVSGLFFDPVGTVPASLSRNTISTAQSVTGSDGVIGAFSPLERSAIGALDSPSAPSSPLSATALIVHAAALAGTPSSASAAFITGEIDTFDTGGNDVVSLSSADDRANSPRPSRRSVWVVVVDC